MRETLDNCTSAGRARRSWLCAGLAVAALTLTGCASGQQGSAAARGDAASQARPVKFLLSNAEGHFFKGNLAEALAGYTEVIAAEPRNAAAYRGRAATLAVLGRETEALADYGRAVEFDPRYDDAWLGRGLYLFSLGRYAEAIDDFDRAAALDPRSAVVHKYRALACEKVGRLREAAASRQAYVHCDAPLEPPGAPTVGAPARELKALRIE